MQYLREPVFWLSVVIVAVAVNWLWKMFTGKGKLV
jgi:hypothetical protein